MPELHYLAVECLQLHLQHRTYLQALGKVGIQQLARRFRRPRVEILPDVEQQTKDSKKKKKK